MHTHLQYSRQTTNQELNVLKRIIKLVQDNKTEEEFMKIVKQMGDDDQT